MDHLPQQFIDESVILLRDENIKQTRVTNIGISYSPTYGIWRPQIEAGTAWQSLEIKGIDKKYNKPMFSGKWFNTFSFPQKWTLRAISLTVTYRFNSTTNKYKGQQSSDEINRL